MKQCQISKLKVQMPNQIEGSNEMPKSKILNQVQDLVRHDNNVILNSFQNLIWVLTFACLREAASVKAGILKFGMDWEAL
jgi:hypothetical protein